MTSDIVGLAERCEKATGPDRELDAEIAKAVGVEPIMICDTGNVLIYSPFTASLDAAMTLVPEGWRWNVDSVGVAAVSKGQQQFTSPAPLFEKAAATPALALCAAALRARAALSGSSTAQDPRGTAACTTPPPAQRS